MIMSCDDVMTLYDDVMMLYDDLMTLDNDVIILYDVHDVDMMMMMQNKKIM